MSSNAFASSRPRVRQQRVPRTRSCDHPRFMQLVNEIARINEAKKKQEEADGDNITSSSCSSSTTTNQHQNNGDGNINTQPNVDGSPNGVRSTNNNNNNNNININNNNNNNNNNSNSNNNNNNNNTCCSLNAPQTSHGYRSLEPINQSTSALHDSYQQQHQPHQHQNHHPHPHHHYHHHHHHAHQNQHHYHCHQHSQIQQQPYQNVHQLNNNCASNASNQDDRCPAKTSTSFGFSKQNLVAEQNDADLSEGGNSVFAQDENRSKRKRSVVDHSGNTRKGSVSGNGINGGTSKRHKSSSDSARPLSPSFTKCPICLLDCMDRDPSFTNTCFHLFCYVCIESWSKNKATCPLCRTKFTKIIFNIKTATSFEEKVTTPIRRDDDDGYIADRHFMLEHLTSLNHNSNVSSRNNGEDVQFLFENLRNPEVLMPQYFVNQMDHRPGESLHSFNAVTSSASFNSNVPPNSFASNYPIPANYAIALSFPQGRIAPTSTAIASAYTANSSLTDLINDPNSRRISRSGRYIHSRNYERPNLDGHSRVPRTTSIVTIDRPTLPLERQHHHQPIQQHQHPDHHHHHQHHSLHHHQTHQAPPQPPQPQQTHQSSQQRSFETIDMSQRQSHRVEQGHNNIQLPYAVQPRHYSTNVYVRRPYNSNQVEQQQHIIDTLYRQMPDM